MQAFLVYLCSMFQYKTNVISYDKLCLLPLRSAGADHKNL